VKSKTQQIPIDSIQVTFFVRTSLNAENVQFLRALYESDDPVTPIKVVRSTASADRYELIDGRHRIEAAKDAGFTSIQAEICKIDSKPLMILEAILQNLGGSLPPTMADLEHDVELLLDLKMTRAEILENFPLPVSVTSKIYKLVLSKIYKRTIRKAAEEVLASTSTVKAAAEKYKVKLEDLKWTLKNRDAENRGDIVANMLKAMETRVRSLGSALGQHCKILVEAYEAGEIQRNDVERFLYRMKASVKHIPANAANIETRLRACMEPVVIPKDDFLAQVVPMAAKGSRK
jgi:ParB-like chromosome segregation protein Spo0J